MEYLYSSVTLGNLRRYSTTEKMAGSCCPNAAAMVLDSTRTHDTLARSESSCLQPWMKLWIVQVCTVDHVKHIGDVEAAFMLNDRYGVLVCKSVILIDKQIADLLPIVSDVVYTN